MGNGKVCLVTGGSHGIGMGIALKMASLGWDVGNKKILDIHWEGGWGFHLKGLKEGETTLTLKVKHHDHADARTPEIRVVVDKALKAEECPFQEDEDED